MASGTYETSIQLITIRQKELNSALIAEEKITEISRVPSSPAIPSET